jgi:hypothetical protein
LSEGNRFLRRIVKRVEGPDETYWLLECDHRIKSGPDASVGRTARISCSECAQAGEEAPGKKRKKRRICAVIGCGTVLNHRNNGSVCYPHRECTF